MAAKTQHIQIRVTPGEKARLKRSAAAAGQDVSSYVLARALPPAAGRFGELLAHLAEGEGKDENRYVLAELNDLLTSLGSAELTDAVTHADLASLSPFLQNYVAAMVEQACYTRGLAAPGWAHRVVPLETPYFAAPLKSLRLHLLRSAPVPFKRRNLFVDAGIGSRV